MFVSIRGGVKRKRVNWHQPNLFHNEDEQCVLPNAGRLIRHADTGHLPIDINACENTIRPITICRKNYFCVSTERAVKVLPQSKVCSASCALSKKQHQKRSRFIKFCGRWASYCLEMRPLWSGRRQYFVVDRFERVVVAHLGRARGQPYDQVHLRP